MKMKFVWNVIKGFINNMLRLLDYGSFKEEYKKVEEKDSGQVIERSYTLFIKVKGTDSYTKKEVKIDTAGKTDIEIGNELKGKVFEYLSWGYKVNE